jgi:hypothetical protein
MRNVSKLQHLVNHIVFVVDGSGSMSHLRETVVKVFDGQIAYLATRSKELDQETRVTVYMFDDRVVNLVYDMDVMRMPTLATLYRIGGSTALIDATIKAMDDLALTPEIYGDHAFLAYVLTDGQENASRSMPSTLATRLKGLPENWTLACLVPNAIGVKEAKQFGFQADNVSVWDATSQQGVREVGRVVRDTTEQFMQARTKGVRSVKNLFSLDASKLNASTVAAKLTPLKPSQYQLLPVHKDSDITKFVQSWMGGEGTYVRGSAYYLLMKPEKVQNHKQVCLQHKTTGKVYSGAQARDLLGLPNYEVKVGPLTHSTDYDIFVQSTSGNRKLIAGTKLLVMV